MKIEVKVLIDGKTSKNRILYEYAADQIEWNINDQEAVWDGFYEDYPKFQDKELLIKTKVIKEKGDDKDLERNFPNPDALTDIRQMAEGWWF